MMCLMFVTITIALVSLQIIGLLTGKEKVMFAIFFLSLFICTIFALVFLISDEDYFKQLGLIFIFYILFTQVLVMKLKDIVTEKNNKK